MSKKKYILRKITDNSNSNFSTSYKNTPKKNSKSPIV